MKSTTLVASFAALLLTSCLVVRINDNRPVRVTTTDTVKVWVVNPTLQTQAVSTPTTPWRFEKSGDFQRREEETHNLRSASDAGALHIDYLTLTVLPRHFGNRDLWDMYLLVSMPTGGNETIPLAPSYTTTGRGRDTRHIFTAQPNRTIENGRNVVLKIKGHREAQYTLAISGVIK